MPGVITNNGKNLILYRLIGTSKTVPTYFSMGDDPTTPAETDTSLTRRIPIYSTVLDDCDATTGWTAGTDSALETTTDYFKSNGVALALSKTGTSAVNCDAYKNLTSQDFTNKDLWMFVYISSSCYSKLTTTGALQLRYGSSSSDYYYWDFNKSALATGWNALMINYNNKSGTVGSPAITTCTYFMVRYVVANASDTTAKNDFVFDVIQIANDSGYYKSFSSGYPIVSETTHQLTTRYQVSSVEANGFDLKETGIFNADSPKLLYSHDTFDVIEKSNYIELIIEQIDVL